MTMPDIRRTMPYFFQVGELCADWHCCGILHPDLHLRNIGIDPDWVLAIDRLLRIEETKPEEWPSAETVVELVQKANNLDISVVDYSDVEFFKFPDDLNPNMIRRLAQSLLPPIRDAGFLEASQFRCGYICGAGYVGEIIFRSLSRQGLTSTAYLNPDDGTEFANPNTYPNTAFDLSAFPGWIECATEWKGLDFNLLISQTDTICDFDRIIREKRLLPENEYYCKLYAYVTHYESVRNIIEIRKDVILEARERISMLMNLAFTAYRFRHFATSFFAARKCITECGESFCDVHEMAEQILIKIGIEYPTIPQKASQFDFSALDFFELLWIASDMEYQGLRCCNRCNSFAN